MYNNHVGFAIFVNPMFLLIFVFQLLFPPIIFQLANSLGNAVHGFALGYGDVLVGRTVLISPRREEQKMMGFPELQACLGGMIDFRKTVLGNQNDGIALSDGFVYNFLFAFGDAGRYQYVTVRDCMKAGLLVLREG